MYCRKPVMSQETAAVRVFCRFRPFNKREIALSLGAYIGKS